MPPLSGDIPEHCETLVDSRKGSLASTRSHGSRPHTLTVTIDDEMDALAALGREIVETGFDYTISNWFATFEGRMRFPGARDVGVAFQALSPEGQQFVRELVVAVTNEAVSNTMWAIERLPWIKVVGTNELTGATTDLTDVSDGLSVAYVGWQESFGQHALPPFDAAEPDR